MTHECLPDDPFLVLVYDGPGLALWQQTDSTDPHFEIDAVEDGSWTDLDLEDLLRLVPDGADLRVVLT